MIAITMFLAFAVVTVGMISYAGISLHDQGVTFRTVAGLVFVILCALCFFSTAISATILADGMVLTDFIWLSAFSAIFCLGGWGEMRKLERHGLERAALVAFLAYLLLAIGFTLLYVIR